jgi:hypothetical protein
MNEQARIPTHIHTFWRREGQTASLHLTHPLTEICMLTAVPRVVCVGLWGGTGVARSNSGDVPLEQCDWEMVGMLPLYDPPRHDTADTIKYAGRPYICTHMHT